ncbi:SDR family oxidoreductase [Nocardia sp. NPDC052254]|uniref:SDR family oxidoreductase n=1 Tax=Nocardia sp. NPDC052254 TaxID=3155681 RepID=UPI0034456828
MDSEVVVVIGVGGMGLAIARRTGPGRRVLLADFHEPTLTAAADLLRGEGHDVRTRVVDVSDPASVAESALAAAELGRVTHVVHTAGLSPAQASASAIVQVDLIGVALVLEEFGRVVAAGGAGVVIASMAGHMAPPMPGEQERALAVTPARELAGLAFLGPDAVAEPALAYVIAKRANIVRVQAAAGAWGRRGARINSISPGVISTPMGRTELDGDSGAGMRAMVEASATGRLGTPDDIAAAAGFLLDSAAFVTGTDLLVDGGVVAAMRTQAWAG